MLGIFLYHLHPTFRDRMPHCTWNFFLQLDWLAIEQQHPSSSGNTDILTFSMYAGVKCRSLQQAFYSMSCLSIPKVQCCSTFKGVLEVKKAPYAASDEPSGKSRVMGREFLHLLTLTIRIILLQSQNYPNLLTENHLA